MTDNSKTPKDILEAHAKACRDALEAGLPLPTLPKDQRDFSGADLRGADLRGADLRGADFSGAALRGADLRGATLQGADLQGADLRKADLEWAYLREVYLRGATLSHNIPSVHNLHTKILAAINAGGKLNMAKWHTCETTHCRAGWAIHLAGKAGYKLERKLGTAVAGALIHIQSCPWMGKVPNFYATNANALADIQACAEKEKEVQNDRSANA